jgi:hypothetical protein
MLGAMFVLAQQFAFNSHSFLAIANWAFKESVIDAHLNRADKPFFFRKIIFAL